MVQSVTWEDWVKEIKDVAIEQGYTDNGVINCDWSAFREYYNDGFSPEEALKEDLSNA